MGILYNGRLPIREIPITEFPYYLPVIVLVGIFIISFIYVVWGGIIDFLNKIDIFLLGVKMRECYWCKKSGLTKKEYMHPNNELGGTDKKTGRWICGNGCDAAQGR